MVRWATVTVTGALVVVGCGGGSSPTSVDTPPPPAPPPPPPPAPSQTVSGVTRGGGPNDAAFDKSANIRGKPAEAVLAWWFARW